MGTQSLGSMPGGTNGAGYALAANGDGSIIVGSGTSALGGEAFRWTAAGGMQGIGQLPNPGFGGSAAWGVNSSGDTVVGYSWSSQGRQAFRWTESTGMVGLGDLPGGGFDSWAYGVSDDGNTVVGWATGTLGSNQPMIWTPSGGMKALLSTTGGATAITGDASVIVGSTLKQAFRWENGSAAILGDLPGGPLTSVAWDVNGNGSVIVGSGSVVSEYDTATYWTSALGMLDLKQYLLSLGTSGLEGWSLTNAFGVSADGLTICGTGINPQGLSEGWVAHVPSPGALACFALASVVGAAPSLARRRRC